MTPDDQTTRIVRTIETELRPRIEAIEHRLDRIEAVLANTADETDGTQQDE